MMEITRAHGEGLWENKAIMPFLLTMTEEEFIASFGESSSRPISAYRGDTKTIDFTVTGASGDTVDISGVTAIFTARTGESDTSIVICDTLALTYPESGIMRLSLNSDETNITPRSYAADIQITMPDSTVATVWRNRFIIKWDVTR